MEALLISADKLKVILTTSDVDKYSLDCENMDYDNTETRRAFWSILDDVKRRTGFDAASQRVLIQVYQSKGGGCELYVTKIKGTSVSGKSDDPVSLRIDRLCKANVSDRIFVFENISDLLTVCKRLEAIGEPGAFGSDSRIYSEEYGTGTRYYLALDDIAESKKYSFLNDYGRECTGAAYSGYLGEHCNCICDKGGIEIMARLR